MFIFLFFCINLLFYQPLVGECGMVGNIGLLLSNLSHLISYHRPQKDFAVNLQP